MNTPTAVLIGLGAGFVAGAVFVHGEATAKAEKRSREKYEEQLRHHRWAIEQSFYFNNNVDSEVASETEDQLQLDLADPEEEIKVGGEMTVQSPIAPPDYVAAAVQYAEPDTFVQDDNFGMEYIETEEYEDDDGRPKEQVVIMMGGETPVFLHEGGPIDNWEDLVGSQILVDFYRLVPPGQERVLYVRNHKLDVDYEVIQDVP